MRKGIHPNMDETQEFQYLEHSNWTICSLLIWFCYKFFPTSWSLYWGAHFLLPQRAEDAEKGFTQTTSFYLYGYLPKYFCKLTINLWKRLVLLHVWIIWMELERLRLATLMFIDVATYRHCNLCKQQATSIAQYRYHPKFPMYISCKERVMCTVHMSFPVT